MLYPELLVQLKAAPVFKINLPDENRIRQLMKTLICVFPIETLGDCIRPLAKRMGTEAMNDALDALQQNQLEEVAKIMLRYYDKAYHFSATKKQHPTAENLLFDNQSYQEIAAYPHSKKEHNGKNSKLTQYSYGAG